jgi:MtfA peptidase
MIMVLAAAFIYNKSKKTEDIPSKELKDVILEIVPYIYSLVEVEKELFYQKTHEFIKAHTFVGIDTEVTEKDKVLVAASIVMMVFKSNVDLSVKIDKIFLSDKPISAGAFGSKQKAAGFVRQSNLGTDIYLSKFHLIHGFKNMDDNKNVGVHEFAHFIDGLDGKIDGFPMVLLSSEDVVVWNLLAQKYMGIIDAGDTLIDRYATKNRSEFFAVVSEFFFENPFLMEKKYPELYAFLTKIYGTDLASSYRDRFVHEREDKLEA